MKYFACERHVGFTIVITLRFKIRPRFADISLAATHITHHLAFLSDNALPLAERIQVTYNSYRNVLMHCPTLLSSYSRVYPQFKKLFPSYNPMMMMMTIIIIIIKN